MNRSINLVTLVALFFWSVSFSQESEDRSYDQFKVLPSEKVYISVNTSLLFTGEYLFYKMYCLNDKTKQLSKISTIGYVELISEDNEIVFHHKIRLNKSQGQGDFFIPTSVPSGNYKLIGYTRWMRNGSFDVFFQEDISIINPYQVNQDALLAAPKDKETPGTALSTAVIKEDKRFVLSTDKESYATKSKVILALQNFRGASGYGSYTVSVRKKETIKDSGKHTTESFIEWHKKQLARASSFYEKITFAPELDGELIKGRLLATAGEASIANKLIGVSIPGEDFQLKAVRTDSMGVFYLNINKDYTIPQALFQVLEDDSGAYKIEIEQEQALS